MAYIGGGGKSNYQRQKKLPNQPDPLSKLLLDQILTWMLLLMLDKQELLDLENLERAMVLIEE